MISVIVPTWNEADQLPACLRSIGVHRAGVEIIVADGNSTDDTVALATAVGIKVVFSPVRQRAAQLNLAAGLARGDVLLFLHADTRLPYRWLQRVEAALRDEAVIGGAFCRRFDHPSWWLRATSRLADWRGRLWGCFLGDQAMFIRAATFQKLGGFRAIDRCEDLDLSLRMVRLGRTCMIHPPVMSSGRRFAARGAVRQTFADFAAAYHFITSWSDQASAPGTVADRAGSAL